jgi:branched-chain amino acid transport system ATP-binding protein
LASDALTLEAVNAYYGDSHVLQNVTFHLREGEVLALLGRNGAGKTTCVMTIMGLVGARRGAIRLFGEDVSELSPEAICRRGIALVPQGRRIFPTLTVRENLLVARLPRRDDKGCWTLDRVFELFPRLGERARQLAGSLSGGEQQMLAIGRALMGNPKVLLLDEPSEGLAPIIVAEVSRTISRLKNEGHSIVLVEQNLKLALDLADRAVILTTGRSIFEGNIAELRADDALLTHNLGVFGGH